MKKVAPQNALDATTIFEVGSEVRNIKALHLAVATEFSGDNQSQVLQVVVIPLFSEFPICGSVSREDSTKKYWAHHFLQLFHWMTWKAVNVTIADP